MSAIHKNAILLWAILRYAGAPIADWQHQCMLVRSLVLSLKPIYDHWLLRLQAVQTINWKEINRLFRLLLLMSTSLLTLKLPSVELSGSMVSCMFTHRPLISWRLRAPLVGSFVGYDRNSAPHHQRAQRGKVTCLNLPQQMTWPSIIIIMASLRCKLQLWLIIWPLSWIFTAFSENYVKHDFFFDKSSPPRGL